MHSSSTFNLYHGVIHDLYCGEQPVTADCTNGSKVRVLHTCIHKVVVHRYVLTSGRFPAGSPTHAFDNNSVTISQVLKYHLTHNVKH